MVVCGSVRDGAGTIRYLDELSSLGSTTLAEFYQANGLSCSELPIDGFPLQRAALADLHGGDREVNARIIRMILSGEDHGPKREAVLLNSAAALFVAGQARSLIEGWDLAARVIDSGQAWRKFEELRSLPENA
jgi:anthranilate phosphoribosyltransferase